MDVSSVKTTTFPVSPVGAAIVLSISELPPFAAHLLPRQKPFEKAI